MGEVQDAFEKEEVLGRLMRPLSPAQLRPRADTIAVDRDIPEEHVCSYLEDLYKLSLPADHSGAQSFCARMSVMIMQVRPFCYLLLWSARRCELTAPSYVLV